MSERPQNRRPATFRLDDPSVVVVDAGVSGPPVAGAVDLRPLAAKGGLVATDALVGAGNVAIAYETVRLEDHTLPLLAPMSEVAGRMAPLMGAHHLMRPGGGRGVLVSGVPGVRCAVVHDGYTSLLALVAAVWLVAKDWRDLTVAAETAMA